MPFHDTEVLTQQVLISNLDANKTPVFFDNEKDLHTAYRRNLLSATTLGDNQHYVDAWILLNISVECFLKYIFVFVRNELSTSYHSGKDEKKKLFPTGPVGFIEGYVFYNKHSKTGSLLTKQFGHFNRQIWLFLINVTDLASDQNFMRFSNVLPSSESWIETRYSRLTNDSHKRKFSEYYEAFDLVRKGPLKEFA